MNKPPFHKPPFAKDVQIKVTPAGRFSVKVSHGHELADSIGFAHILWLAGQGRKGVK